MATDYAGLIPNEIASEVLSAVREQSAVLRLARVMTMPKGTHTLPVASLLPSASFVAARGGRKPQATIEWSTEVITPELIAAIVAIPDDFINDAGFPIWENVRPELAAAIAEAFDEAILDGTGAPASYPTDLFTEAGAAVKVDNGVDTVFIYDTFNEAFRQLEVQNVPVTGVLGNLGLKSKLRGEKDSNGLPLWQQDLAGGSPGTVFDAALSYTSYGDWATADSDALLGDFSKLVVGIREDIRFDMSTEAVLRDGVGAITVSAFQDNMTLMRVETRIGAALGKPYSRATGAAETPFRKVDLTY